MRRIAMLVTLGVVAGSAFADAKSDFQMIFGAEAEKVRITPSTADDAAFAAKLLESAKALDGSPALQLLLYEKAYAFGLKDRAGHATAQEALKLLAEAAPDRAEKVAELRYKTSRGAAKKVAGEAYLDMLLAKAEVKAAGADLAGSLALYRKAHPIATYIKSPRAGEIAAKRTELGRQLVERKRKEAKLKALRARLLKYPRDAKTRREVILLYLLELDKPAEAAKLVTDDLDEALRTYVPLAPKPIDEIAEAVCLELAGWYEQLGSKMAGAAKETALRKAVKYYRAYLERHTAQDATALKAKLALDEVEKTLAKLSGSVKAPPRKGQWIRLLTSPDKLVGWQIPPRNRNSEVKYARGVVQLTGTVWISYPVKVKNVVLRASVRKLGGGSLHLSVRRSGKGFYSLWYNGGTIMGVGKHTAGGGWRNIRRVPIKRGSTGVDHR